MSQCLPPIIRHKKSTLGLESLESRLNLSTLAAHIAPHTARNSNPVRVVGVQTTSAASRIQLPAGNAATAVSPSAATTVAVGTYSSIAGAALENTANGPDIAFSAANGTFAEYSLNAPAAGTYTLNLGVATNSDWASWDVYINGAKALSGSMLSTGGWQTYINRAETVSLAAGANTIRIVPTWNSRLNMQSMTLTPIAAPLTNSTLLSASPATTAVAAAATTTVPINSFTASVAATLESTAAGTDVHYSNAGTVYTDYTLNATAPGTYTLNLGLATAKAWASWDVYVNGAKAFSDSMLGTDGWQNYTSHAQTLTLAAGVNTIRIVPTWGSELNLKTLTLSPINVTVPTVPDAPPPITVTTPTTPPVSISQRWMTSFTELDIVSQIPGQSITVSQFGNTFTIVASGQTQQVTGSFGDLVLYGSSGNETLTIDSSVNIAARIYSGTGNDTIKNLTRGQATIVTLNGGANTVTGNGINTAYWVTAKDTVNASTAEKNAGDIHAIANFYQPYTSNPAASGYVTNIRDGANLIDPTSAGNGTTRLTTSSLWGIGPDQTDINQGQVGDCYFLASLQSLARLQPGKLEQMAVDLGDGTYAVAFTRNNKTQYVRVDGDLPTASWGGLLYNHLGASGNQWASIMEKAYAYFRTGANSYASLDNGFMTTVYSDLGLSSSMITLPADQNAFYSTVSTKLAANKSVDLLTTPNASNPMVASHCYSVTAITKDAAGTVWITLRNPWGYDGYTVDSNYYDGLITISYSTLKSNVIYGAVLT